MALILSVSYDKALLLTRQLLLQQQGHRVVSALQLTEAVKQCGIGGFDLCILGHSIARCDKEKLIEIFRRTCNAPILSLEKAGDTLLDSADYHLLLTYHPEELLKKIAAILGGNAAAAAE